MDKHSSELLPAYLLPDSFLRNMASLCRRIHLGGEEQKRQDAGYQCRVFHTDGRASTVVKQILKNG